MRNKGSSDSSYLRNLYRKVGCQFKKIFLLSRRFNTHQTMFLAVVEPVPRATRTDDALQLVGFDPNDFVDSLITPESEALPAQLHGASGDPEEDVAVVLEIRHRKLPHLIKKLKLSGSRRSSVNRGITCGRK